MFAPWLHLAQTSSLVHQLPKREMKFVINSWQRLAVILRRETAHHTPTFKECNGLSWKVCRFSALHILLLWLSTYPLGWNHASSQQ
jgi:hypothetical protein